MELGDIEGVLPPKAFASIQGISELRPAQEKAIKAGLFEGKNVLVCTPTASGKTLIAEFASVRAIDEGKIALYIVPLKALASEKKEDFSSRYTFARVGMTIGDMEEPEKRLGDLDWIVCTAERLDSLIRHHVPWLSRVGCVVVDEVHLLNDPGRGPVLEILITMLRKLLPKVQVVALSATIGNAEELATWLRAELVVDDWRPVELKKGTYVEGKLEFIK